MSLIDSPIIASGKILHDSEEYLSYVYVRYFKEIKRKYMSHFCWDIRSFFEKKVKVKFFSNFFLFNIIGNKCSWIFCKFAHNGLSKTRFFLFFFLFFFYVTDSFIIYEKIKRH